MEPSRIQRQQEMWMNMKSVVFTIGGLCAAAAGFLLWSTLRTQGLTNSGPVAVDELAHRLEEAWADHHTLA